MKKPFIFILSIFVSQFIFANDLIPKKISLTADIHSKIIYQHQLKKDQTIYGLSKFLNVELQLIEAFNPGVDVNNIKLNETIKIPISKSEIVYSKAQLLERAYVPVYYIVKPKDNLFRISTVYFNQSIKNIILMNKLSNKDINVGQELLIGWYEYNSAYRNKIAWQNTGLYVDFQSDINEIPNYKHVNSTQSSKKKAEEVSNSVKKQVAEQTVQHNPTSKDDWNDIKIMGEIKELIESAEDKMAYEDPHIAISNNELRQTSEAPGDLKKYSKDPFEMKNKMFEGSYASKPAVYSRKVTANWNSEGRDKKNLFALHATAKVNSYIEIYNPMLNRKVIAKVVGNIPENTYKKDVELIVSPKVAQVLGAVDKKFFVKIKYIK